MKKRTEQNKTKRCNPLIRLFFLLFFSLCQQQQAPSDISKIGSNGIERLKKRVGNYRQHHHECRPRYDQTFSGVCEQQSNETAILQKRYEQSKAKKAAKKADKKTPENSSLAGNLQGSIHVVSSLPNEIYVHILHVIKGSFAISVDAFFMHRHPYQTARGNFVRKKYCNYHKKIAFDISSSCTRCAQLVVEPRKKCHCL